MKTLNGEVFDDLAFGGNSEFGEDVWINEHIVLPEKGFYVDLGCGHPVQFSNSAFLRGRGWDGIAVDGNPAYADEWAELAPGVPFVPAVLAASPRVRFRIEENSLASRICETGDECMALTLEEVLNALVIEQVDFLSLDLEGAEFEVFQTLDLSKHQPKIVVAEYNTQGIGEDFRLRDYLVDRGYRVVHQTIANFIYLLEGVQG